MLVLSRKKDETIVINNDISITICEIRGNKVRVGIEAPLSVSVLRKEVWLVIQEQSRNPSKEQSNDESN